MERLAAELRGLVRSVPLVSSGEVVLPAYTLNLDSPRIELIHRHLGAKPFYRFMFLAQSVIPPASTHDASRDRPACPGRDHRRCAVRGLDGRADTLAQTGPVGRRALDQSIGFVLDNLTNDMAAVKSSTARLLLLALPSGNRGEIIFDTTEYFQEIPNITAIVSRHRQETLDQPLM